MTDTKLNRQFFYAFAIVVIIIFGLFFLNQYYDIPASSFTTRNVTPKFSGHLIKDSPDIGNTTENFNEYFNRQP